MSEEIVKYVQSQFPQIAMHGGSFEVIEDGKKNGHVALSLGDACGGCNVSPMTTQMIKERIPQEFDYVNEVTVFMDSG